MPVDNQVIIDKIDELHAKLVLNHKERSDLILTISELKEICEEEDPLSEETPKAKKPIIDKGTGAIITPVRRQEIYDSQIAKADTLLS